MSRRRVLHLAPADRFRTGIASYADIVDAIFAKYLSDEVELQRVTVDQYLGALAEKRDTVVLAQVGSNEGEVFRALLRQRRSLPAVRRIIEIHDPPLVVLSYTTLLERLALTLPGRAARRLFDRLFGDRYVRSFAGPMDVFVCKTEIGATALRQRFSRLRVDASVICIELPNYLDAPAAKPVNVEGRPSIGFFGYVHPDKGAHVLVDAAIRLHASRGIEAVPRIFIRGALATPQCEAYVQDMQRRVRDAGLADRIEFGGFVPFEQLPGFVAGLTAVALPYMIGGRSSASGPLLWARTCGVPVLAHRTAVFQASVRDGVDGVLVGIGDLDDWATVLERVATEPGWAEKLRPGVEACQAHASWSAVSAQFRAALALPQVAP
jgi:glycosyltransferase involved in cell wall biosynthesis